MAQPLGFNNKPTLKQVHVAPCMEDTWCTCGEDVEICQLGRGGEFETKIAAGGGEESGGSVGVGGQEVEGVGEGQVSYRVDSGAD